MLRQALTSRIRDTFLSPQLGLRNPLPMHRKAVHGEANPAKSRLPAGIPVPLMQAFRVPRATVRNNRQRAIFSPCVHFGRGVIHVQNNAIGGVRGIAMRKTRQGLLNSTSYSTVAIAAGLGSAFAARPPKQKKRALGAAATAIGAGAVALTVGMTAAPQPANAEICGLLQPVGATLTQYASGNSFACGPYAYAKDYASAVGFGAKAIGGGTGLRPLPPLVTRRQPSGRALPHWEAILTTAKTQRRSAITRKRQTRTPPPSAPRPTPPATNPSQVAPALRRRKIGQRHSAASRQPAARRPPLLAPTPKRAVTSLSPSGVVWRRLPKRPTLGASPSATTLTRPATLPSRRGSIRRRLVRTRKHSGPAHMLRERIASPTGMGRAQRARAALPSATGPLLRRMQQTASPSVPGLRPKE